MTSSVQKTFPQLLIEGAKDDPDRLCLVLPKESSTYGEIFREALNIAKSLKSFGISKGDPVGILMANSVRYVESLFAVSLLGACLLYTSPSPRDAHESRMPSSA